MTDSATRALPDNIVHSVDSWDFAEDGKTFTVMATTQEGLTLIVSLCPGEPVSVSLHDVGEAVPAAMLSRAPDERTH